ERDADDNPDHAGEVAELRSEGWADERARARDGREVAAEDDPPVRRHVVAPVLEPDGGCRPIGVEREDLGRDQLAIEAIRDGVATQGRGEQPRGVDRLAASERDPGERQSGESRNENPNPEAKRLRHVSSAPDFEGRPEPNCAEKEGTTRVEP